MKRMWTLWMVFLFVVIFQLQMADAATVISTGKNTGNYFKVGNTIAGMMKDTAVIPSMGSIENIENLLANKAQVALVQMDALAWYMNKHPEAEQVLRVVGPAYEECAFIAVNADGIVKDEDDLQKEGPTIAVGEEGTGSTVTWDYMRILEKGYAKSKTKFEGGLTTLGELAMNKKIGGINAYLFVTKPDVKNKMLQTVATNSKLKFIDVDDSNLNNKLPLTGEPVYSFKKVVYGEGTFSSKKVSTICMDSAIIARKDLDMKTLERLSDIVLNYKTSIQ